MHRHWLFPYYFCGQLRMITWFWKGRHTGGKLVVGPCPLNTTLSGDKAVLGFLPGFSRSRVHVHVILNLFNRWYKRNVSCPESLNSNQKMNCKSAGFVKRPIQAIAILFVSITEHVKEWFIHFKFDIRHMHYPSYMYIMVLYVKGDDNAGFMVSNK